MWRRGWSRVVANSVGENISAVGASLIGYGYQGKCSISYGINC
jgi:uncharacterized membrane protein YgaE (UPF0421/DUF939 family)